MKKDMKRELLLEGLGCANCSAAIEEEITGLEGVSAASVNFVTKTLTIEADDSGKMDDILNEIKFIIRKHEPDIVVKQKNSEQDTDEGSLKTLKTARILTGALLYGIALIFSFTFELELILFLAGYVLVGGDVVLRAIKNLAGGRVFDENFLMSIATAGALVIGEFPEGVAVMLFYQIGELFQDAAVNRSRRSIKALMNIRPDYANLKTIDGIRKVSPEEVEIGDTIVIRPGEKIPLDGKVTEGSSMLDTSALTGESVPREVGAGDTVLSGFINKNGLLTVEVTKEFGESTVSRILDMVQNAGSKKARTENFITKFARYYTPAVVLTAAAVALIPTLIFSGAGFTGWVYRALIFLVISCPCALVISIPLGFFGGIGGASKNGILIKGSNYLEGLNNVDTVVFDKTGTLTKGVFKVTGIYAQEGITEEELLEYAAYAESYSGHPIANSVVQAYGREIDKKRIESYEELPGYGIKAVVNSNRILAGNARLMQMEGLSFSEKEEPGTVLYLAVNGNYAGYILVSDQLKEDSKSALNELRKLGVKRLVMLTGDRQAAAEKTGGELGLNEVYSELLPHQKVERVEYFQNQKPYGGKLVFVGDGINDAPVLARADIGVAMGGLGSDAAIEAADVVLMTDEPSKLVEAIKIAKRTRRIVWQNIIFALSVKAVVLLLGAGGIATMWEAVFADVGVAVLAILNAMRVMKVGRV